MRVAFLIAALIVGAASGRGAVAGIWEDAARSGAPRAEGDQTGSSEGSRWLRLAAERTRVGDYNGALDAYDRLLAIGDAAPATLVNSAELLMALGRVKEAVERYREAVEIEGRAPDRREHLQGLALGYFGLAVALDRDDRTVAAREAMGRALALDPGLGILELAARADSQLFFVPPGDVFYYLGLAREAEGRFDDAAFGFRDYLRVATGPFTRFARAHLARLAHLALAHLAGGPAKPDSRGRPLPPPLSTSPAPSGDASRGMRLRVIHQATLVAVGPLVAPLIDAAWRMDARLLDACLTDVILADTPSAGGAAVPGRREFRLSVDLRIEDSGRVGAVAVKAPAALGNKMAPCIEDAIQTRFRVSRPSGRKPTHARMELVLAPAAPGGV